MKAMLLSDMMMSMDYLRRFFALLVLAATIASFLMRNTPLIIVFGGSVAPLALLSSLMAYDARNDWEGFRLALPLSRRDVVFGRYMTLAVITFAGTALCALVYLAASVAIEYAPMLIQFASRPERFNAPAFILCVTTPLMLSFIVAGSILPFTAHFGLAKAVRYLLAAGMAGTCLLFSLRTTIDLASFMPFAEKLSSAASTPESALVLSSVLIGVSGAFYLASALIASRLYDKREF